jgi:hypothetical protein
MLLLQISGAVFLDRNGNGTRDPAEPGLPGIAVSNQHHVVQSGADGAFHLAAGGTGIIAVSVPSGYRATSPFWRPVSFARPLFGLAEATAPQDFIFIHASDTHISPASVERTRKLKALVDSIRPAFVLITGDLTRDALRVPETEARSYYELFEAEIGKFTAPVWTIPGNHEIFGIERHLSLVSPTHPLYGRAMYRHYRGPDYYSFTFGGIHFVGLNSVDISDLWYYGHVDSTQVEWLRQDLAALPATTSVVTFNHIPFFTAVETINGLRDGGPAPSVITVNGQTVFRHSVSNAGEILAAMKGHPYPIALGGHMHTRELLSYPGVATRFHQSAAVIGPSDGAGLNFPSGITVYRVKSGMIDDGTFVPIP